MNWTLPLLAVFIVQEPVSTNAVLLEAYQHGYNVWLIHLWFILATIFDIVVGYCIGSLVHRRYSESRFARYISRKMEAFSATIGKGGTRLALFIYGPIIFPVSAILAPWLGIGFWEGLIFMFLGDLVFWYALLWLVVLGVKSFVPDPSTALYLVALISLAIFGVQRYRRKRVEK